MASRNGILGKGEGRSTSQPAFHMVRTSSSADRRWFLFVRLFKRREAATIVRKACRKHSRACARRTFLALTLDLTTRQRQGKTPLPFSLSLSLSQGFVSSWFCVSVQLTERHDVLLGSKRHLQINLGRVGHGTSWVYVCVHE